MITPESNEHTTGTLEKPSPEEVEEIHFKPYENDGHPETGSEKSLKEMKVKKKSWKKLINPSRIPNKTKKNNQTGKGTNVRLENRNGGNGENTTERWRDMENLGKRTGTTETSITNRIQEIEEGISGSNRGNRLIDRTIQQNQQSLLTLVDTFTGWIEAFLSPGKQQV